MKKLKTKIVQIFRTASSTWCPPDQPTKTILHQAPLKAKRELLKVTNQRCVGRSACTLRSSFSARLGALAGHYIVSAGDLRNPEWMWLHFFLLPSALWWPVMSDPMTSNGAASCYDTNATQATGASKVIGKSLLVLIEQEASWLSWENNLQSWMSETGLWFFCTWYRSIRTTPHGRCPMPDHSDLRSVRSILVADFLTQSWQIGGQSCQVVYF